MSNKLLIQALILNCSFALTFGLDTLRTRDAVTNLHRGGIDFAMKVYEGETQPRYLSFLEILTEFSTKLIKQDKITVLHSLEKALPPGFVPATQVTTTLFIYS